jgi:hypothetical protein
MEWIESEKQKPEIPKGESCSANVLAWLCGSLSIMAYCYIDDGDENSGWAWCNCGGDIEGDPEFDDDYKPTHWMPLPEPPKPSPNEASR